MIDLLTVEGLKAAASAWPGGRPLYIEAFGRRMIAAEAIGDDGTILLRLKDDGSRMAFVNIVAEKDHVIAELTDVIAKRDALIASLQPKPDAQPSESVSDAAITESADAPTA